MIAHHLYCVRILGETADLTHHPDSDAVQFGDLCQPLQMFDFFVEWRAQLTGGYADGDHFGCFGQFATGFELLIVLFALRPDIDIVANHVQTIR